MKLALFLLFSAGLFAEDQPKPEPTAQELQAKIVQLQQQIAEKDAQIQAWVNRALMCEVPAFNEQAARKARPAEKK